MSPPIPTMQRQNCAVSRDARIMFFVRACAVGPIAALAACTASGSRETAAIWTTQHTAFTAYQATVDRRPLVFIPNSGTVTSVQETRTPVELRQSIVYGGRGGGRAELAVRGGEAQADPALAKPTRIGIATELASLTPDGPYQILTQPVRNAYGAFGVAVGSRCAYAWQWIRDIRGVDFGVAIPPSARLTASLRIQHCRREPTRSDLLVADLVRLRLGAGLPFEPARSVRRVRPVVVATQRIEPAPTPSVPVSPPPQMVVNGSRTLVSATPNPPQSGGRANPQYLVPQSSLPGLSDAAIIPRPGAAGSRPLDQPRYLTDLAGPAGSTRTSDTNLVASPRASTRLETLSPDLPAQAYRGPTSPPFGW